MSQFASPISDTYIDNWQGEDASVSNLYTHIDDVAINDVDYIRTQLSPTNDVYVFKLAPLIDPEVSTGHIFRIRAGKDAAGGDTIDLLVELRQGYLSEGSQGTLIGVGATLANLPAGWTTYEFNFSGADANQITDYTNLFVRCVANKA